MSRDHGGIVGDVSRALHGPLLVAHLIAFFRRGHRR